MVILRSDGIDQNECLFAWLFKDEGARVFAESFLATLLRQGMHALLVPWHVPVK